MTGLAVKTRTVIQKIRRAENRTPRNAGRNITGQLTNKPLFSLRSASASASATRARLAGL